MLIFLFNFIKNLNFKYVNLFDATDDEQSRASTTRFIVDMLNESIPDSTIGFNDKAEVFTIDSIKEAVALKDKWCYKLEVCCYRTFT